ncbi:MAG: nickel pincer cofactor biosynthesis protein LarC [Lachnospiraceae bacterium]
MISDRILYLECRSGISGDMTVAALLDLGANENKLREALDSLPLDGYEIRISRVKKSGLDACDFAVLLDEEHENHDHDMNYLHGDMQMHNHSHHHTHRGLPEIRRIIEAGTLTDGAKKLALRMFDILADAEAKAHGVPREQVHFHEVGAVDSIVDIVAAAVCLDDLSPERIVVSALSEGTGMVRCQHGVLPIPVPAVTNIVTAYGLPIHHTKVQGELVTPTGAAIAAAVMQKHNELPVDYTIENIGIGAGKRAYETVGILRAMWILPLVNETDRIVKLEANIDDATGEQLSYCMDCLMEAGARDVSFVPLYMKKNRPAYEVHVICDPCDVSRMEEILFRETTTIGVRRSAMERTVMQREERNVETPFGSARVKVCSHGTIRKIYPEYESVRELCRKTKCDFRKVYQAILDAAE